jgi:hypothetical protein
MKNPTDQPADPLAEFRALLAGRVSSLGSMARGDRWHAVRPETEVIPAGRVPRVHRQVPRRADPRARGAPTVTHPRA